MNKKNVIIVDDEIAARQHLRSVINEFEELCVVSEAGDGKKAIKDISEKKPDIVFLDIEMPEVNGFDVAKATANLNYQLVFVTAYDQYALDAFDTRAIDYLVKPVRPMLLKKCIDKILRQEEWVFEKLKRQTDQNDSIVLDDGGSLRVLRFDQIMFIEGIGRYRRIHLTEEDKHAHGVKTIVSDTTLEEFGQHLPPEQFFRLHRSYLVNTKKITRVLTEMRKHYVDIDEYELKIPVSRSKVASLKNLLKQSVSRQK